MDKPEEKWPPLLDCKFISDGVWFYFDSEAADKEPGHAGSRMRSDGANVEQITQDERVSWVLHMSPYGRMIAFPSGILGQPADKGGIGRIMKPDGRSIVDIDRFSGGQRVSM